MDNIQRPLSQIEAEINILKVQTAQNIIEIGKRLIEAKEQLQHGAWGFWLKERVVFSERTAQRFMRVAEECSKSTALSDLPLTKVYTILELPSDQREDIISKPQELTSGEVKMIDEMTTRELQELIKARKNIDDSLSDLDIQPSSLKPKELPKPNTSEELEIELQKANYKIRELENKEPLVIEKEIEISVNPPDYDNLKKQVLALTESEKKSREEALNAKNEAKGYKQYIETFKGGTKSFEAVNLIDFKYAVRDFLRDVTPLIYLGEQFLQLKESERSEYLEELETIERWVNDFRSAMAGNAGGANIIVIEGRNNK